MTSRSAFMLLTRERFSTNFIAWRTLAVATLPMKISKSFFFSFPKLTTTVNYLAIARMLIAITSSFAFRFAQIRL